MRPSSVISRPEAQTHPYFPVEPERPRPGVLGQILRAGILAALLALAVGAPGTGSSAPDEVETQLTPTRVVELPFVPFVAPAQAESEPKSQPAAQTGGSGVAPRQVAPSQPEAQTPTSGGGDTSVTYDNGSNDVSAGSGGSSVNNSANLDTRSGVSDTEGDPEP